MAAWCLVVALGLGLRVAALDSVEDLQRDIRNELQRVKIAEFVVENAKQNKTAQDLLLNESLATYQDCQPRYAAAVQSTAEAQAKAAEVEEQLNQTQARLAATRAQKRDVERSTEEEEEKAQEAEEGAAEAKRKADAVLPERQAWVASGIGLFMDWLEGLPCQNLVALLAAGLGLLSLMDSELFILLASLVLVAVGVGVFAGQKFFIKEGGSALLAVLVGGEAAFLTGAACVVGYAGFQLFLGAVIGLMVAQLCAAGIRDWVPGQVSFWYLVFLTMGVAATGFGGKRASETLGYAAGGLLLCSSLVFFLAEILTDGSQPSSWVAAVDGFVNGTQDLGSLATFLRLIGFVAWVAWVAAGPQLSVVARKKVEETGLKQPLLAPESPEV